MYALVCCFPLICLVHRFAGSQDEKISFRRPLVYIYFLTPCFQAFACIDILFLLHGHGPLNVKSSE